MRLTIAIFNRQRALAFDLKRIRRIAEAALPGCYAAVRSDTAPLAALSHLEVSLVSDLAIGRVHAEFFNDPEPTDVITFHHGELLLGAGVITENARRFGHTATDEAALCVVHGMLHLAGWDDLDTRAAKEMARQQEQIFKQAARMVG